MTNRAIGLWFTLLKLLILFQLGVALGFNCQFDSAVQALEDAIRVLEKRIENLKNSTESKGEQTISPCLTLEVTFGFTS